jgi:hypothetical protein
MMFSAEKAGRAYSYAYVDTAIAWLIDTTMFAESVGYVGYVAIGFFLIGAMILSFSKYRAMMNNN